MIPLGIKCNNLANIRFDPSNHWIGQVGSYKGFCKFKTNAFGVRALLYLLRKYRYVYGLDTIKKIISRFAPSNENDTELYINNVSFALGVPCTHSLHLDFYSKSPFSTLYHLTSAIINSSLIGIIEREALTSK